MNIYLSFGISLISGIICARLAKQRGRSSEHWFMLGMFFGFLAMGILYLLPRLVIVEKSVPSEAIPQQMPPSAILLDPRYQEWFFLDEQRQPQGPLSFRRLFMAWQDHAITEHSYVWTEGMAEWRTIGELPSLLDRLK